jgi:hypothetical protein
MKELNEKLFDLQQEIGTISKDTKNPFYKSKYFDVNSLIKQLQPLLKKNRLLLLQPIEDGSVTTKIICIDSNLGTQSSISLPEMNDPQKLGSAITYYRRYTLASLLGLQADDDDANIASGKVFTPKNDDKPWLNKNTPQFNKAIEYLKNGGNISAIDAKYKMKKEIKDELLQVN